jgi:hypothetical protein
VSKWTTYSPETADCEEQADVIEEGGVSLEPLELSRTCSIPEENSKLGPDFLHADSGFDELAEEIDTVINQPSEEACCGAAVSGASPITLTITAPATCEDNTITSKDFGTTEQVPVIDDIHAEARMCESESVSMDEQHELRQA